ncbi:RagB/SusD family nutrient uptake outer membrane protein [Mucilaginibacter aquaedulcis]|uniref:RagB/SusD family nutrient uptake outer membrane protein n=1 Tax=Mucilaginibacter aquaedulcis TaxID=1187081 RepID=UPI0025B2A32C|nr:RagB/SusD family nutrient uptake outer membrane protein [Mucilaginibacter aquaedulcis]MDN3547354.1 RagB/SusD family nutrient uptake outer membrane protein [Mucilaginibacter aquaedulcis]
MNKYHKILPIVLLAAVGLTSACKKDFLNKQPISQGTAGNYYKTAADAEGGLVGAYSQAFINDQYWVWDYVSNGDARADNCYAGGDNPDNFAIAGFTPTPQNGNSTRDWQGLYQDIYAANIVLDYVAKIPASSFTGSRQQEILSEAKFIRAISYFQLVTTFGDVPLILSTINTPAKPSRAAATAVYAQIENDLTTAEAVLPVSFPNVGHATKGAVQALLAKVYAQEGKYQQCLDYSNKVINSGQYSLVPNYATLFDGTKNTSESIFESQHSAASGFTTYNTSLFLPAQFGTYSFKKFNLPTANIIALFKSQNDNIRLNASVYQASVTPDGLAAGDPIPAPYTTASPMVPFLYKWKTNISQFGGGTDNNVLLRLADIILLKAEASNNLGQTAAAILLVNQIRARVKLPAITVTSQADVALAILTERRMELAFEGHRWNDLLRFGAQYTITLIKSQVDPFGKPLNFPITQAKLIMPVPYNEIQLDGNLTQNPGY